MNLNLELNIWKIYDNYDLGFLLANKLFSNPQTYIDIGVGTVDCLVEIKKHFDYVLGFEPGIQFVDIQEQIQNLDNIDCYNLALSDKFQKKNFYIDSKEPDISSFNLEWLETIRNDLTNDIITKSIYTYSLDSVVANLNIPKIDYIKIDAEDEDSKILIGSKKTLIKHKPILQIENIDNETLKWILNLHYVECNEFDNIHRRDTKDRFFCHKYNEGYRYD